MVAYSLGRIQVFCQPSSGALHTKSWMLKIENTLRVHKTTDWQVGVKNLIEQRGIQR